MGQRSSLCVDRQSTPPSRFASTSAVVESSTAALGHDFNATSFGELFIGISGLIGAGKSTLATALGKELGLPVYYEPVADNDYLADFYKDMHKYAFPMQIFLLNKRFRQQQQAMASVVVLWTTKFRTAVTVAVRVAALASVGVNSY
eukprot:TRINITY_DN27410_c0_g1_i1.p1 TRINITY_DN27410_c0_g1~~TRINITY_DN27410_c0_g1_i1.p1  ORF type:complete len:162 (+),score=21.83 TRINITY_DN27410_c0_g1_i1:50-487(+)